MSKKPPLTLVGSGITVPQPPCKLGERGMKLWRDVHTEYAINDIGGVELLAQACASLDRAEALAKCINEHGEVVLIKGVLKTHPAVRDELACRSFVVRTLHRLGLNLEQVKSPGRPSGGIGITWEKNFRERE
jgi:hypothetical protein